MAAGNDRPPPNAKTDRIMGSILGLALGDAFGAPYEGGALERALWAILGKRNGKRRWTDDTQMTLDVIESLVVCGRIDQSDLARRFAASYRWSRGYGPGAAKILKRIRRGQAWQEASRAVYRDGSFGNGAAMRASAIGLFFAGDSEAALVQAASDAAMITHAHPLGREGAVLIALATCFAYHDIDSVEIIERLRQRADAPEFSSRLNTAQAWLQAGSDIPPRTVAGDLGNGIAAVASCVTAIYAALAHRQRAFDDLLAFAIGLRGDVDTIAAMAGAIWGAHHGVNALPPERLAQLAQYDRLQAAAQSLADTLSP